MTSARPLAHSVFITAACKDNKSGCGSVVVGICYHERKRGQSCCMEEDRCTHLGREQTAYDYYEGSEFRGNIDRYWLKWLTCLLLSLITSIVSDIAFPGAGAGAKAEWNDIMIWVCLIQARHMTQWELSYYGITSVVIGTRTDTFSTISKDSDPAIPSAAHKCICYNHRICIQF